MRRPWLPVLIWLAAGCPKRSGGGPAEPPSDPYPGREKQLETILLRELEIEVLEGYQLPSFETAVPAIVVSGRVGAIHIGVGPDDVVARRRGAVDRWPLLPVDELGARLDAAESKRLEMHLSEDLTTAWISDEISYRVPGCVGADGKYKVVVIPLRLTALYVRDGERWVGVLEHLSYPQRVADLVEREDPMRGKTLRPGKDPRPGADGLAQVLSRALDPALTREERIRLFAAGDDALALWPDPAQELRKSAIIDSASLAKAFDAAALRIEPARIGMSPDPAGQVAAGTVGWIATTLQLDAQRQVGDSVEPVTLRLRATFVLERRAPGWQIVQSHVSAPVDDAALLAAVLGSAEARPWERPCEGKWSRPRSPPT